MFLTEFLSFLSGTVFGMFITAAVLIHMLSGGQTQASFVGETAAKPVNKIDSGADEKNIKEIAKGAYMNADTVELEMLNKIIDQLEDFNYPLKQIVADLHRIHDIHEFDSSSLAEKMKGVIELATIANMERDFSDRLSEMKENGKQLRSVMVFLSDLSKACAGFAKELHRLHNVAKTNKNKGTVAISVAVSVSECKEEQILMNWWSAIDKAMHHISADHEELASGITDELLIHSSLIQEDYVQLEKKYHSEASKQAALLKEHINSYESKLRETSKNKEKVRGVSDKDHSKRVARFKTSEEALRTHLVKLYEIQKDFYLLYPRLHAEIQVTVLKSLVETQTQLCKLAEKLDRAHENGRNASRRFKLQLTDAAAGLVRSIREENLRNISHEYSESPGGKDGLLPVGHKIAGYEESLQKVLEGVLIQSKLGDSGTMERSASEMELASKRAAKVEDVMPGRATPEEQGTLNMHSEYASSLAASNPSILPELPLLFSNAISTETCVWFNAFSGRVYRDISNSKEFYQWFCKKLAMMLNKGPRPSFIEEFQVLDVEFGALPPLLLNVKWSPPYGKKSNPTETNTNLPSEKDVIASGGENNGLADVNDRQSLNSKNSTIEQSPGDAEGPESVDSSADDGLYDTEFYAACTADFAFRSGMKFKIATK